MINKTKLKKIKSKVVNDYNDDNDNNDKANNDNNKKNKEFRKIKTINGNNCIGPCYPPNTIYYNPTSLVALKSKFPTCPINAKKNISDNGDNIIYAERCDKSNINDDYLDFDIFDDFFQIADSSNNFLIQIYEINNIVDCINFLNNSLDIMPIFSQKRLLCAIFDVYYKYIEFPKLFFSSKVLKIITEIYKLKKISSSDIVNDLNKIKSNKQDIFIYFEEKYS